MIRTDTEHQNTLKRLQDETARLDDQQSRLQEMGLSEKEIERVMAPMLSFKAQLEEEVEYYESLKRGEFEPVSNLENIGNTLIALRIAKGLTQRELAERLGVHESQVSRDERNDYHSITVERMAKILDALGMELQSEIKEKR